MNSQTNNFGQQPGNFVLGLDIGIASVGWALLRTHDGNSVDRIVDLGVRTFDKGETAKEGKPLNLARRLARGGRRRLRRRAHRMLRLRRLFRSKGLLDDSAFDADDRPIFSAQPWKLRAEGLDRELSGNEWAEVLYHLIKHRGYLSTRKSEAAEGGETGKVLVAVKAMTQRLQDSGYRTIGEMAYRDSEEFDETIRNKQGEYRHCFDRRLLLEELKQLFQTQREHGNEFADEVFETQITDLLMTQRPALSGKNLLKMLGHCTFETSEYRAPRASYSAERFAWLSKLNHIRVINPDRSRRALTVLERQQLIDQPYIKAKLTYAQARKVLDLPAEAQFVGLRYRSDKNPERETVFELKGWHRLRKGMKKAGLETEWKSLVSQPERLDTLAWALSVYKDDAEIREYMTDQGFDSAIIEAVLSLSFDKFAHLSFTALRKLIPHLEDGLRYDEACSNAGYNHNRPQENVSKGALLPPIPDDIRNPVVVRALSQARKVINAIVREYGSPVRVQIELARDLSRPKNERDRIEREQKKWRDHKKGLAKDYIENFGSEPNGRALLKYRLYKDQGGKCAYSLQPLDLNRINEAGYVDIDHILPYSRTYDDSLNNKVLVRGAENRNKGNRTPWEYFGERKEERWAKFETWVKTNRGFRQAKRNRLLKRQLDEADQQDFKERNLNDTRYIARFLKNYVERHLLLANASEKRVRVVSGSLTSFLRARWGLIKVREEGDLHHALDAAVVAAATDSMIKRLSDYSRYDEMKNIRSDFVDPETGEILDLSALRALENQFPDPWLYFRNELKARLSPNPAEKLAQIDGWQGKDFSDIRPVTVSRAPHRKVTGQGHLDTIRSAKRLDEQISITRVALEKLTPKLLESMHGRERDQRLYEALKKRLNNFGGKPEKAFAEPFFKPSDPGRPAPRVRHIKVETVQKSGIPVRKGVVAQATMARVDVYQKNGKYFLVPVYAWQISKGMIPVQAVIAYKPESDWELMDKSATYLFSLQHNDMIQAVTSKQTVFGYFSGLDRATGAISISSHDRNINVGKNGVFRGVGVKSAKSMIKYEIDVLGRYWPVSLEKPPWDGEL